MSIKITGLKEVQNKLKKLQNVFNDKNMQQTMHTIGNMVKNKIDYSFEHETSPYNQKWSPISYKTALKYAKGKAFTKKKRHTKAFLDKFGTFESKKILRLSGHLADNWEVDEDSNKVIISNNSSNKGFAYGLTHQFGSKKLNIPARPFLLVKENNLEPTLKKDILNYLESKLSI